MSHARPEDGPAAEHRPDLESLRLLLDGLEDVVFRLRLQPNLSFDYLSPASSAITGYSRDEWLADPRRLLEALQLSDDRVLSGALRAREDSKRRTIRLRRRDGRLAWVEVIRRLQHDRHGRPELVEGVVRDVTARVESQQRARRAQALFEAAFEQSPVGIGLSARDDDADDEANRLVAVNPELCRMLGRHREELLDRPLADFVHPEDRDESPLLPPAARVEDASFHSQKRYLRADRTVLWAAMHGVVVRDENGDPLETLTYLIDVSDRVAHELELQRQALHDPLTGLPNRRLFTDRLQHALTTRKQHTQIGLLLADIDDLKAVNDAYGHTAGDAVIREIGSRFAAAVRPSDTVARLGNDEFAVLCPDLPDSGTLVQVADRMLDALDDELQLGAQTLRLSARIGATAAPTASATPDALLAEAGMALLQAKSRASLRLRVYDQELGLATRARREHERQVREAVALHQFELHYQPIVDIVTGETLAAEALVRWRHPSGELRPPALFLETAERLDLIDEIDRWVLERACRDHGRRRGTPPRISLNLHPSALGSSRLVETVADTLAETGKAGGILCFEVTERAVISDPKAATGTITGLRDLGCAIALDDFGAGFSSLNQLAALPVDILKLDREFISQLTGPHDRRAAVVRSLVSMAEELDVLLIAEGVETEAHHELLIELGCPHAQGFLYGRPAPLATA